MQLNHSFTVPASVQQTWDTFMDLDLVGSCFPGATVTEASDDGFAGSVKVKLGPIALVYTGVGSFVEKDEATHLAVIKANGKDKRGNGTAGATVKIQLSEVDGVTHVDVATDLAITGKPAQFGRGVMQDVSDKLLGQFVSCIEGKLGDAPAQPAAAVAPAKPVATEPVSTSTDGDAAISATTPEGVGPETVAETPAAAIPAAAATERPAAPPKPAAAAHSTPTKQAVMDDNALNGLALVPIVLKSLWHRLLVALRLRKREE
ncbi:SRPBCC family protein [Nakamurella sp. A5-74]|uniref:SRPBCC family protein n=1 Tax=Nakamurella sp. A5-74 TaxID=3158264 RepID=A0AAU8DMX6_9ACTN